MKLVVWFLTGLASLAVGFFVWLPFEIMRRAADPRDTPFLDLMAFVGFVVMVGGPIVFWLVLPGSRAAAALFRWMTSED